MAVAKVQGIIDFYILQKSDLTNKLSDIMMEINYATKDGSKLASQTADMKAEAKSEYYDPDSDDNSDYYNAVKDIESDYELKLANISQWESELEVQKEEYEAEIQQVTTSVESYKSLQKKNITDEFSYGKGASSS